MGDALPVVALIPTLVEDPVLERESGAAAGEDVADFMVDAAPDVTWIAPATLLVTAGTGSLEGPGVCMTAGLAAVDTLVELYIGSAVCFCGSGPTVTGAPDVAAVVVAVVAVAPLGASPSNNTNTF